MNNDASELSEEEALAAVRRLDADLKEQYETPLLDADGTRVDPAGLAVDSLPNGIDDTENVELTLGQTDDLGPGGAPDSR